MRWLEICWLLPGELVEPIADLISRYAPNSFAIEGQPDNPTDPQQHFVVRAWLPDDNQLDSIHSKIEAGLRHLSQIQPIPGATIRWIDNEDWHLAWQSNYQPILVGQRLRIVPAWMTPDEDERIPILIDPGMAFGTGTHPTTHLSLESIETNLKDGQVVVDLGCGSGILSIAAACLGAKQIFAYDIDENAILETRKNAERNHVSQKIHARVGSLEEVLADLANWPKQPDLVLANIVAPVLEQLLSDGLHQALHPNSYLILSGMLDHQAPGLLDLAAKQGLKPVQNLAQKDWKLLVLQLETQPI